MAKLSKEQQKLLEAAKQQDVRAPITSSQSAVGLGVDLIEINRIERAIERTPRLLTRVFSGGERAYARNKSRPATHYALFFAAKEATLKALGTGFAGMNFTDVEVSHDNRGKPIIVLHGNALAEAQRQGIVDVQLSLSHAQHMGVASAVAIKANSAPKRVEQMSQLDLLAQHYRRARAILDDMDSCLTQLRTDNDLQSQADASQKDALAKDEVANKRLQQP
ncbi:MAG: holo-ACP synthase [Coriobacteriales bacterium]|jgi:holo-[acyl-carrier protein] synthase|nr:holo-ACP synthase [Coriobacteriales bacterium]